MCFQEAELLSISHSELSDLKAIGQGGFGVVYRAQHARLGTVVYKKLNAEILGDRYLKFRYIGVARGIMQWVQECTPGRETNFGVIYRGNCTPKQRKKSIFGRKFSLGGGRGARIAGWEWSI